MNNNLIYVVAEPGLQGFSVANQHGDHSIDLVLNISEPLRIAGRSSTYSVSLGIRTYTDPACGGILMLPRSSCSNVNKLGMKDYYIPGVKIYDTNNISLANTVGYIDWSYRGEWSARILTEKSSPYNIQLNPGTAYFQAVPLNPLYTFVQVSSIDEVPEYLRSTTRGEGGYGSTSK